MHENHMRSEPPNASQQEQRKGWKSWERKAASKSMNRQVSYFTSEHPIRTCSAHNRDVTHNVEPLGKVKSNPLCATHAEVGQHRENSHARTAPICAGNSRPFRTRRRHYRYWHSPTEALTHSKCPTGEPAPQGHDETLSASTPEQSRNSDMRPVSRDLKGDEPKGRVHRDPMQPPARSPHAPSTTDVLPASTPASSQTIKRRLSSPIMQSPA